MLRSNPSAEVGAEWMGTRCKLRLGFRSLRHPVHVYAVNLGVWGRAPTHRAKPQINLFKRPMAAPLLSPRQIRIILWQQPFWLHWCFCLCLLNVYTDYIIGVVPSRRYPVSLLELLPGVSEFPWFYVQVSDKPEQTQPELFVHARYRL